MVTTTRKKAKKRKNVEQECAFGICFCQFFDGIGVSRTEGLYITYYIDGNRKHIPAAVGYYGSELLGIGGQLCSTWANCRTVQKGRYNKRPRQLNEFGVITAIQHSHCTAIFGKT